MEGSTIAIIVLAALVVLAVIVVALRMCLVAGSKRSESTASTGSRRSHNGYPTARGAHHQSGPPAGTLKPKPVPNYGSTGEAAAGAHHAGASLTTGEVLNKGPQVENPTFSRKKEFYEEVHQRGTGHRRKKHNNGHGDGHGNGTGNGHNDYASSYAGSRRSRAVYSEQG